MSPTALTPARFPPSKTPRRGRSGQRSGAPRSAARNAYRLAVEALRQALGFATNSQESLRKVPEFVGSLEFAPVSFELQSSLDSARAGRPELARSAKLTDARSESITTAKSNRYPTLSAVGGWQLRKGSTDTFGDSRDGWLVGLQSQWNIFDGSATNGRVAQARSALEISKLTLGEATLAVDVEVRRALSSLQEATELAEASQKVVAQARRAYGSPTPVTERAPRPSSMCCSPSRPHDCRARNQIQAYYSYNVAVARVRKAIGTPDSLVAN